MRKTVNRGGLTLKLKGFLGIQLFLVIGFWIRQKTEAAFKEDSSLTSGLEEGKTLLTKESFCHRASEKKKKTHEERSIQILSLFLNWVLCLHCQVVSVLYIIQIEVSYQIQDLQKCSFLSAPGLLVPHLKMLCLTEGLKIHSCIFLFHKFCSFSSYL